MARNIQMVHSYTFDNERCAQRRSLEVGKEYTEKSSFGTLEKAIENAQMWINKSESWIDTTVTHIEIINKETKETLWTWQA